MSRIAYERRRNVIVKLAVSEDLLDDAGKVVGRRLVEHEQATPYESINAAKRAVRLNFPPGAVRVKK